jgi:hypothetical protein
MTMPTEFTFDVLRDAVVVIDEYVLIDPYGDQDGDPFYDLEDVVDFITNNSQVDEYLNNYRMEAA